MANHIKQADVDLQAGVLTGRFDFSSGLNLLSGENGTLKTKLLQALKAGATIKLFDPSAACRIQAVSPKRNAQRRAFKNVFTQLRRNATRLDSLINERKINDAGFEDYPALGDLFYVVYDDLCRDGGDQVEKMNQAVEEFNDVIRQIFDHYELKASWNTADGAPSIELHKHGHVRVPLEGLSLGEMEVLSLATSIYASRNRYDVYLIDEPEVHLNWHLEERLFDFLDAHCRRKNKQMIVVTHSRVVFKERFLKKTTFLYWTPDGKVDWGPTVTPDQRRRIAGDAIEIIKVGEFDKPTFFVEDTAHATVVEKLAELVGVEVSVSESGNRSNVRTLYRHALRDPTWTNSVFLEDGDGEGNPFPEDDSFIHLRKYCIENYLLDLRTLAGLTDRREGELQALLHRAVLKKKDVILKRNKFLEFLVAGLKPEDLTPPRLGDLDASLILPSLLEELGYNFVDFVVAYLAEAKEEGRLDEVMPAELLGQLRGAVNQEGLASPGGEAGYASTGQTDG